MLNAAFFTSRLVWWARMWWIFNYSLIYYRCSFPWRTICLCPHHFFNFFSPCRRTLLSAQSWCRCWWLKFHRKTMNSNFLFPCWAFNRVLWGFIVFVSSIPEDVVSARKQKAAKQTTASCVNIINIVHNFIKSLEGACCVYRCKYLTSCIYPRWMRNVSLSPLCKLAIYVNYLIFFRTRPEVWSFYWWCVSICRY